MVVRTQSNGRGVSGLLLKAADVRRHIPKNTTAIELQLGELRIDCPLSAEFWHGRPQLCDRRLLGWLEFKIFLGKSCRTPVSLEMTPTGKNSFRLQIPSGCDGSKGALPPHVTAAGTAFVSKTSNPVLQPPAHSEPAIASHPK
jgi:hypothetical protein